jgi:uncharacterized protein (DUF1778 family)
MIYNKTEQGKEALLDRASGLLPRQRSAFIMFDGKRSTADVLKATAGLGVSSADVEQMLALGWIEPSTSQATIPPALNVAPPVLVRAAAASTTLPPAAAPGLTPTLDSQAHFLKAWPIATRLTAGLGLRGFRLNLAVESAGDLAKLKELAPRIKEAVGAEKFRELEIALYQ